ncbi:MAG: Uncharacterised protein [Bacteroidetes bacterium MED-G17]|nr:MAG: Uncharacterised protein [Bacteroidetes bacterium MED-G17]
MGNISEKNKIPNVIPIAKINRLFSCPPNVFSAKPPTKVAPRVFAIVLRLKIAELVSSNSSLNFSSSLPFLGFFSFSDSISATVMLRIIASSVEQRAEIPIVRLIAEISSIVIYKFLMIF